MKPQFDFMATGIGSVPFLDREGTCQKILKHLPDIPFWPQFVKRSHLEEMNTQVIEGLPFLRFNEEKHSLVLAPEETESQLVTFYDHYLAEDVDFFATSTEYAAGLPEMIALIQRGPERHGPYIKGQIVGPVTLASGITDFSGKSILHNPDLLDATVKGLAIKALWQARELGKTGRKPIIFIDEPSLTGFGSAFSAIQRDEVINLIKEIIDYLRERSDTLVGIHCCGNTDWSMLLEAGPDIINFDAYGYMDYFLLYSKEITQFLKDGGTIAWGIIPTGDYDVEETVDGLFSKLKEGVDQLHEWGLDKGTVRARSMLTPSCGMGSMDEASADKVLHLLSSLSERCGDL